MERQVARFVDSEIEVIYYYVPEDDYFPVASGRIQDGQKSIYDHAWYRHGGLPCVSGNLYYDFYNLEEQHRLNGPAFCRYSYMGESDWQLYDKKINPIDYFEWLDETGIDINNITPDDKVLIALRWNQ